MLVTRAALQAGRLSEELRALGFESVEVPVIEVAPPASYEPFDAALRRLASYNWLIFTSVNAVSSFDLRVKELGIELQPAKLQIAAIGQATAQAVEELLHFEVSLTPKDYVAESLAAALKDQITGKRALLARAALARDVIPDALRAAGAWVDAVDAYRNVVPQAAPAQLRAALVAGLRAATFTSSSSATHLAEVAKEADIAFPLAGVPAVSIGPITSRTLRELGWPPAAEASPHDIPGLAKAVARLMAR